MAAVRKSIDIFAPLWRVIALAGGFSLVVNVLMLTGPLFMLQIYDRVLPSRSGETLIMLVLIAGGLLAVLALFDGLRSRVLSRIGLKADAVLKSEVWRAALAHRLATGDSRGGGTLRDLDTLRQFIAGQALVSFFDAPWAPIYIVLVFLLHPLLGAVALGGALALFVIALINEWSTRQPIEKGSAKLAAASTLAEAGLHNAEAAQSMGIAPRLAARWAAQRDAALDDHTRANDRLGSLTALSKGIRLFLQVAILGVGASLAIQELLSPGAMIAASIIMSRALAPVEQSIANWRGFVNARGAYRRIRRLLAHHPAPEAPMPLPAPQGKLTVEGAILREPGGTTPLIKKLSFKLEAGEALGVIGPSGAGKSSLARMLVGVWRPVAGAVRLDGAALEQWDPAALGQHIGYLPQTVELFDGTVRQNIARFDDSAPAEAVLDAAKRAGVHETVLRLPNGYDTRIGPLGSALSAGQRQRIGLARALFGDPALVVLDEPNAHLDRDGELALAQAIKGLKERGCTCVVMAHRPSAIEAVDKILILQGGERLAFGAKDDVLASRPGEPAPALKVPQSEAAAATARKKPAASLLQTLPESAA